MKKIITMSALSLAMKGKYNNTPDLRLAKKNDRWRLKKCKSCKSYKKYGYGKCTKPMNQACEDYEPKKKG